MTHRRPYRPIPERLPRLRMRPRDPLDRESDLPRERKKSRPTWLLVLGACVLLAYASQYVAITWRRLRDSRPHAAVIAVILVAVVVIMFVASRWRSDDGVDGDG